MPGIPERVYGNSPFFSLAAEEQFYGIEAIMKDDSGN
jgi:hypothetical protein